MAEEETTILQMHDLRPVGAHSTLGHQISDRDLAALREQLGEGRDVDDLVFLLEGAAEATELRKAHVQRELTAFEARANLVARPPLRSPSRV